MPLRRWTQEEDDLIRERYPDEGAAPIAQELGWPVRSVYERAQRLGVKRSRERLVAFLREVYPTQGSQPVAERFGLKPESVRTLAHRLGIKTIDLGRRIAAGNTSVNIDYFKSWSPDMAYILGYIWADGSLDKGGLSFGCVADDEAILIWIKQQLASRHAIRHLPGKSFVAPNGNTYLNRPQVRLYVSSTALVEDLIRLHGLRRNKSAHDLPFPNVPEEHLCHFARGHFDGDGCIWCDSRKQRASFMGTPTFLRGLASRISEAAGVPLSAIRAKRRSGPLLHQVEWCALSHTKALYSWLYPEGFFCLERKRAKWATILPRKPRRSTSGP